MNIRRQVEEFLNFATGVEPSVVETKELIIALDYLACSTNDVTYTFDERDYLGYVNKNETSLRESISTRFPQLGYYNSVSEVTENIGGIEPTVGDSIDDLVDIIIELQEVSWRFENTSSDDALWHFYNGYWTHWGRHLRGLQSYLHYELYGA